MMIPEEIRRFVEERGVAFVASADTVGHPHLGAGIDVRVAEDGRLLLESWCCPQTLRNVATNPQVAVAVTAPDGSDGYLFVGVVERLVDTAVLDGYAPSREVPGMPQVASRFEVRVDKIMGFSAGVHTDTPLALP